MDPRPSLTPHASVIPHTPSPHPSPRIPHTSIIPHTPPPHPPSLITPSPRPSSLTPPTCLGVCYEAFGYNLYLEENISKDSSKNKIKQGKQKLFKKYGETSKQYLRKNLFENPCVIKSEKCKYLDTDNFVTIYYNELTDLFAILDSNKNTVLDFGVASEVKYAEIFVIRPH